jgi:hypothetical protein
MAIDLISVPTVTMEVADITGDVLPDDSRTTDTLSQFLANNAVTNVLDYAAGVVINTGVNDAAPAIGRALVAIAAGASKRLYFPTGTYRVNSGVAGIIGNNGYHGLAIVGDSTYSSRIIKHFDGDLFQMDAVLNLSVRHIGFDGNYGTNTGKGFVLTGNCNVPRFECDFVGFSGSHIEFGPDCGYNAHIATNHFSGAGQGDYRAIHVSGPDTTATPRVFTGVIANGYIDLDGALDSFFGVCFVTRIEIDNNCNETTVSGGAWADQQNFLANIPISIGGHQTQIGDLRIANAVVLIAGSTGALVGNRQSGSPIGLGPLTDNSSGGWCVLHPAFGETYHWIGRSKLSATIGGEIPHILPSGRGDISETVVSDGDATSLHYNTSQTANRTTTLSVTGARPGARFHITRYGGNTGGPWTRTVVGAWSVVLNNNESCLFEFDGTAWICVGRWSVV